VRGGLTSLVACCLAAALLAGCGSDDTPVTTEPAQSVTQSTPRLSPAQQARAEARKQRRAMIEQERTFAPNPYREPGPTTPHATPLRRLIVREVKRGRGPALQGDENVYANYVKTYWKSGRKFLTAWGPGRVEYLSLPGQAPGIRRGMTGMRPGGRRTIAMPATISEVHTPNGGPEFVAGQVDIVLRKILSDE
jgi:FKBP-type peptidyl-prolyl cis-trans isomerase